MEEGQEELGVWQSQDLAWEELYRYLETTHGKFLNGQVEGGGPGVVGTCHVTCCIHVGTCEYMLSIHVSTCE